MGFDRYKFFRLSASMTAAPTIALATPSTAAPTSGGAVSQAAGALAYLLPYFIGAQFGGVVGTAIPLAPLSLENAIDLVITMVILLIFCWLIDLSGKFRRSFSNRG